MQVPRVLNRMDWPATVGPPGKLLLSAVSLVCEGGGGQGRGKGWKERPEGHERTRGESKFGPVQFLTSSEAVARSARCHHVSPGCYRRVRSDDAEVPTNYLR